VRYLLDTSVWYRAVVGVETIPPETREILTAANERFGLSAISLWEIGKKVQIGKLRLNRRVSDWLEWAVGSQIEVLAIDVKVVADAMNLPGFPNRHPADELIVATARMHELTLLTTDRALRNYRHARIKYFKPLAEA